MTLKDVSLHFDKHPEYFRRTTGVGRQIVELYGEISISNVVKFNRRCGKLIYLVNEALKYQLISKRELCDAIYGIDAHVNLMDNMLNRYTKYTKYSFIKTNTFSNYIKAEACIIAKLNVYERIVNDN